MDKALKPCRQPGCPELVKTGYCDLHKPIEPTESPFKRLDRKKTPEEKKFYSSGAWTRTSKLFRKKHKYCAECKRAGTLAWSQMVHHIIPVMKLKADGKNPLSWRYLEALCNRCHLGELRAKKVIDKPVDISKFFR